MTRGLTRRAVVAAAAGLAAPALAGDTRTSTLRFVPQRDLTWFDPTFWPFLETRNHAMMIYDTLFGTDAAGVVQPQMADGHVVEDGGRTWRIRLREGLLFHDGAPVLARDCVASILRWGAHNMMGQALMAATAEVLAPDDRTIVFRLQRRFPMLAAALGAPGMASCVIMPARIAEGAEFHAIGESIGSGPFRFLAGERQAGRMLAYARHDGYVPRGSGLPSFTAGPKLAHFDRVEWHVMPDAGAALGALQSGMVDWWEGPPASAYPAITGDRGLALRVHEHTGFIGTMRMNHLTFPFNDPEIRRAVLPAVDQDGFMLAANGGGAAYRRAAVGFFTPQSPMASAAGMAALPMPPDVARARAALAATRYRGETVVVLGIADMPAPRAMAALGVEMLRRVGFTAELVEVPVAGLVPRLLRQQAGGAGGWNAVFGYWSGLDHWHPGMHRYLSADGTASEVGWPTSQALEAMRRAWLAAPDLAAQRSVAADIQVQAFADVPYVPLGQWLRPTAYAAGLTGMLDGYPMFWNLRRG